MPGPTSGEASADSAPPTALPAHEAHNNNASLLGLGGASVDPEGADETPGVELPTMGGIAGGGRAMLSDKAPADMTLDDIIDQVSGWFPPDVAG